MKSFTAAFLLLAWMFLTFPGGVDAETRTVSWTAVTTYTDGTPIEPTKTVTYDIFWTQDAALSSASLRTVASSIVSTSATFDPDILGMPRGQTVYFTGDAMLNTGEKSALASAYPWSVPPVSPPPGPPTLTGVAIFGPSSVNESGSGTYTTTATWSDGSTTSVTPTWSVAPTTYASINASGVLTTLAVTANQSATVTASYTSGGVSRSATQPVTVVDLPDHTLATPQNVGVTGPVSTSPSKVFRLKWDPVKTLANGTPVPEGSVTYDAYWTTDSTLAVGNLISLAASSAATSVDFDPNSAGMPRNQRVYFTTKAKNTVWEPSALAPAVSWVANNQGPASPKNARVNKK